MLASVNFGSGTSASPNTTSDTSRELGSGSPVTETVGEDMPSPYLADSRREYREFAMPRLGLGRLLQDPSYERYRDFVQMPGDTPHEMDGGSDAGGSGRTGATNGSAYGRMFLVSKCKIR